MTDQNYDPHLDDAPTRRELQDQRFFEKLSDQFDRAYPDLIDQSDLVTEAAKAVIAERAEEKGDVATWIKSKPKEFIGEVASKVRERIAGLVDQYSDGDGGYIGPTTGISGGGSGDLQTPSTLGAADDDLEADAVENDPEYKQDVKRYGPTGARTRFWQRSKGLI